MSVYFIATEDRNAVKIGVSADARKRLSLMQTGSAQSLLLLREIEGADVAHERWLHRQFAADRIRGEWFRFNPRMLTIGVPEIPAYTRTGDAGILDQIEALSHRCEVSRADLLTMLGINRVTFWRISTGKTTASRPVFTRMEATKQDLIRRLGEAA